MVQLVSGCQNIHSEGVWKSHERFLSETLIEHLYQRLYMRNTCIWKNIGFIDVS